MLNYLPEVTIHSALADPGYWEGINHKGQVEGHSAIKLWYFLRAVDYQGCGNVTVDLRIAAIALDRSLYTIRRWVKFGLAMGIFRSCRRVGTKIYRIFYTSLENLCAALHIRDIGACTDIEVSDLNNAKIIATEVLTKQLQQQSNFQAKGRKRKNLTKCVPSPEVLTTSELCSGAILHKAGRFTYLKRYAHAHGTCQKTIAWNLGRHVSTVQRRLSNGYRQKRNLEPLPKTQLLEAPKRFRKYYKIATADSKWINCLVPGQKLWNTHLGLFKLCPNVYNVTRGLTPKRRLRGKVKRAVVETRRLEFLKSEDDYKLWLSSSEGQGLRQAAQNLISSDYET